MQDPTSRRWLRRGDASLDALASLVATPTEPADCPGAAAIERGVPLYDCEALRGRLRSGALDEADLMAEWIGVWQDGPGILVLKRAFADMRPVDEATACFEAMIREERLTGSGGDHFAKAGANDRVWNALEKLCLADPAVFARYYANDMIALASQAWLGPGYQITSQVNNVRPGGAAQSPHRDYHLGFCTPARAEAYPAHVHRLSPMLTLQGAIAHVDMPLASGPTLYLPHSQKFAHGYLVSDQAAFTRHFETHCVQLPLAKGDAVFFNPALLHAAGSNVSPDIQRMANLLQVSSAFGRAMETVDRDRMVRVLYPELLAAHRDGRLDGPAVTRVVAAAAEGYAFPTNLDRDPPLGGLAPASPQAVLLQALEAGWSAGQLGVRLDEMRHQRLS